MGVKDYEDITVGRRYGGVGGTTGGGSHDVNDVNDVYDYYDFTTSDGGGTAGAEGKPDDKGASTGAATPQNGGTEGSGAAARVSPYARFKGNNLEDIEKYLRARIDEVPVESEEARKKREKRERQEAFLSRLADGLGTFHTAFAHARGEKPMEMPEMSAKAKERYERAKAEREKERDRLLSYYVTLGKLKDSARDFDFRVAQAEDSRAAREATREAAREAAERAQSNWERSFQQRQDYYDWQKKLGEGKLDETTRHNKAQESRGGGRHGRSGKGDDGMETVTTKGVEGDKTVTRKWKQPRNSNSKSGNNSGNSSSNGKSSSKGKYNLDGDIN